MDKKFIRSINPRKVPMDFGRYLPVLSTHYVAPFVKLAKDAGYTPIDFQNDWKKFIELKRRRVDPPKDKDVDLVGGFLLLFKHLTFEETKKHYIGILYYAGVEEK